MPPPDQAALAVFVQDFTDTTGPGVTSTGPNQVWQFDFSGYETSRGGTWRTAGVADYWSKYEFAWH